MEHFGNDFGKYIVPSPNTLEFVPFSGAKDQKDFGRFQSSSLALSAKMGRIVAHSKKEIGKNVINVKFRTHVTLRTDGKSWLSTYTRKCRDFGRWNQIAREIYHSVFIALHSVWIHSKLNSAAPPIQNQFPSRMWEERAFLYDHPSTLTKKRGSFFPDWIAQTRHKLGSPEVQVTRGQYEPRIQCGRPEWKSFITY